MSTLIIVDCEATGLVPSRGQLTEFGAVNFTAFNVAYKALCAAPSYTIMPPTPEEITELWRTEWMFHGRIIPRRSSRVTIVPEITSEMSSTDVGAQEFAAFTAFRTWLKDQDKGRSVFVSDNPAFDFMWIADGFVRTIGENPFGHSGRRISDFYAGLMGDLYQTQEWKDLRITPHDHNPVHDSMGNAEALARLLTGVRP